jgi:hypothetical protein
LTPCTAHTPFRLPQRLMASRPQSTWKVWKVLHCTGLGLAPCPGSPNGSSTRCLHWPMHHAAMGCDLASGRISFGVSLDVDRAAGARRTQKGQKGQKGCYFAATAKVQRTEERLNKTNVDHMRTCECARLRERPSQPARPSSQPTSQQPVPGVSSTSLRVDEMGRRGTSDGIGMGRRSSAGLLSLLCSRPRSSTPRWSSPSPSYSPRCPLDTPQHAPRHAPRP